MVMKVISSTENASDQLHALNFVIIHSHALNLGQDYSLCFKSARPEASAKDIKMYNDLLTDSRIVIGGPHFH